MLNTLADSPPSGEEERTSSTLCVGVRIREARLHRRLSLAEVAERAGVSKSLIHQIERGTAMPSLDTVGKVASALGVPVFSLFLDDVSSQTIVRATERRKVMYPGSKATREILSPHLNGRMVHLWVTFPPGEHIAREPVRHVGEECVIVLRGTLEVLLGDEAVLLQVGDSMTFNPEIPHLFRNATGEIAEIIAAISPPNL